LIVGLIGWDGFRERIKHEASKGTKDTKSNLGDGIDSGGKAYDFLFQDERCG
jgi:hypothetical protein